jgi:hypothetical protein
MKSRPVKTLCVTVLSTLFFDSAVAHPIPDGEELGATVRYVRGSNIQAWVELRPKVSFDQVRIQLGQNAIGGAREICDLGAVTAGQVYRCLVVGDVPAEDPGLVINVIGSTQAPDHGSGIARKSFSVANPDYDRVADQKGQRDALQRSGRNAVLRVPDNRKSKD